MCWNLMKNGFDSSRHMYMQERNKNEVTWMVCFVKNTSKSNPNPSCDGCTILCNIDCCTKKHFCFSITDDASIRSIQWTSDIRTSDIRTLAYRDTPKYVPAKVVLCYPRLLILLGPSLIRTPKCLSQRCPYIRGSLCMYTQIIVIYRFYSDKYWNN
jgi:hypothetical protein